MNSNTALFVVEEVVEVLFGLSCIVAGLIVARRSTGAAVGFGLAGLTGLLADLVSLLVSRAATSGHGYASIQLMQTTLSGLRNLVFYAGFAVALFALARAQRPPA